MQVQSSTVHKLCNVMPCNTYLFYESCTKSQHITKVESDIRKIDNRCCYRRESELTVQTRNTCYQLQKIVLVFFFLSLSVLFFYSFYDNLLHSGDIFRYPQALTSRSQDEPPRKPTRNPNMKACLKAKNAPNSILS